MTGRPRADMPSTARVGADALLVVTDLSAMAGGRPTLPFSLSANLNLIAIGDDDFQTITRACEALGHPHRDVAHQGWCPYAFMEKPSPIGAMDANAWDADGSIKSAVAMSHLVRPTSITGRYAVRLEWEGEELVDVRPFSLLLQTYVHDIAAPPWFSEAEAIELRELLQASGHTRDGPANTEPTRQRPLVPRLVLSKPLRRAATDARYNGS